jgi:hypothetical protein
MAMEHKRLRKVYCAGVVKNFGQPGTSGNIINFIGMYHSQPGGSDKTILVYPGDYCRWSSTPVQRRLPSICPNCGYELASVG